MVVKGKKQRSVPPSRARYEKSHPTVTIRVDLGLYNELKGLKETAGMSLADILKVGLGKAQAATAPAWLEGYESAIGACYEEVCPSCQNDVVDLLEAIQWQAVQEGLRSEADL